VDKKTAILIAGLVLIMVCHATAAPVGTVDIKFSGYGAKNTVKFWGGGHEGLVGYAGVYMFEKTGGTGQGNYWDDGYLGLICIELSEFAPYYEKTYEVVFPEEAHKPTTFLGDYIGEEKADYLSELWGRFFEPDWIVGKEFTEQQKSDATAFNVAVWEIIYEDLPASPLLWDVTTDGTQGKLGFRCIWVDSDTANAMLHALDGTGPKADLRAFVYDGKQDYIIEVPEPATLVLLGLGCLVLIRKRKY